ncbi:endonuclease III [Sulfolobales archaeon HS-7]|nr:endonuclease III [Sulfolobales archaeon HS-7]
MICDGSKILKLLKDTYKISYEDYVTLHVYNSTHDPFKTLIATVLSQNSTDKTAMKIFLELDREVGITPDKLATIDPDLLKKYLKKGGLYNNKTKYIIQISKVINALGPTLFKNLLENDTNEAKKFLTSLPGIGEKTADVVLLLYGSPLSFPVDTHIFRVSHRLGITRSRTYNQVSEKLKQLFPTSEYLAAHLLLIAHGRNTCKARKPLCGKCPIKSCCDYYITHLKE